MIRIARVAAGTQKKLDIAKSEMVKIAKVATAAHRELDIARGETRLLNKVIHGLQQRLDELEGRGSVDSDHPPLESGSSDDGWGPGPGPGRAHAPGGDPGVAQAPVPPLSAPPLTTAWACNLPYLRIPQSHKYTKRMTDYEPRSTNPLSGSTSYIYKMR